MPSFLDRFRRKAPEPQAPAEPEPIAEPESPGQPAPKPEPESAHEPGTPRPHHVSKPPRLGSTEERGVGPGSD